VSRIYIEGGGDTKEGRSRCREAFSKLLEKLGITESRPKLIPCGRRDAAYDSFKIALNLSTKAEYIALWVDSEDPVGDIEQTWSHLKKRDQWNRPDKANDDNVLLMVTCMETWILADRETLRNHYC